ncbi:MAG TPA: hypothetical protein HPP91_10120 [Gammaproteobacteria bacterium]|nr:hypothetical protein [Gammaproteobacteria bacterium]
MFRTQEKHNAGDYFIRSLLFELKRKDDKGRLHGVDQSQLHHASFSPSTVKVEFRVEEKGKKSRAVDIAIFIPNQKLAIFIENKMGSNEHNT